MQCLYCKKKLGLFASKKQRFCSKQHEVSYIEEQAGLAMRRVMDPLFAPARDAPPRLYAPPQALARLANRPGRETPVRAAARVAPVPPAAPAPWFAPPPPLSPAIELGPVAPEPAEDPLLSIVIPPPLDSFLPQPPVDPIPSDLIATDPFDFTFSAPQARLPLSADGLIDDAPRAKEETPLEPDPAFSHRLHPMLEQQQPEWIEDEEPAELDARVTPVAFERVVSRELPPGLPIGVEFVLGTAPRVAEAEGAVPPPAEHVRTGQRESNLESPSAPSNIALRHPWVKLTMAHGGLEASTTRVTDRWSAMPPLESPPPAQPELIAAAPTTAAMPSVRAMVLARRAPLSAPPLSKSHGSISGHARRWVLEEVREAPVMVGVPQAVLAGCNARLRIVPIATADSRVPIGLAAEALRLEFPTWALEPQPPVWRESLRSTQLTALESRHLRRAVVRTETGKVSGEGVRQFPPVYWRELLRSKQLTVPESTQLRSSVARPEGFHPIPLFHSPNLPARPDSSVPVAKALPAEAETLVAEVKPPVWREALQSRQLTVAESGRSRWSTAGPVLRERAGKALVEGAGTWVTEVNPPVWRDWLQSGQLTAAESRRSGWSAAGPQTENTAKALVEGAGTWTREVRPPVWRERLQSTQLSTRETGLSLWPALRDELGHVSAEGLRPLLTVNWPVYLRETLRSWQLTAREGRQASWPAARSDGGKASSAGLGPQPLFYSPDLPARPESSVPMAMALPAEARTWVREAQPPVWREALEASQLTPWEGGQPPWLAAQPENGRLEGAALRPLPPIYPANLPARPEPAVRTAQLAELSPEVQADRRHKYRPSILVVDSIGFQRVRAASFIQIREPELRKSIPGDLPAAAAQPPWRGVRMSPEMRGVGLPVPLRPEVQTPGWAG